MILLNNGLSPGTSSSKTSTVTTVENLVSVSFLVLCHYGEVRTVMITVVIRSSECHNING